ncbi:MAG: APC family permease [Thermoplasmata archaeon]
MALTLKRGSMTFWGLVFYAIMVISPAGPFAFTGASAMDYAGKTAPLTFLIGGITLFLAVIAVYIYTEKVSNAGGYYKFIEVTVHNKYLSKSVGFYYLFVVLSSIIGSSILLGWFTWIGLETMIGYSLPFAYVIMISFITPVIYLVVGILSLNYSQKIAVIVGLIDLAFYLALSIAIIIKSPFNGVQYFNIMNSTDGLHGFFLGMIVGGFVAFSGYGSIVVLAEETKMPEKTIKKAIVTSLLIMIAYDTFVIYANVAGAGPNLPSALKFFAPGLFITKSYYGIYVTMLAFGVFLVSALISTVIFGNSAARDLYSLARDGILPSTFAKIHQKYRSPYMAVIAVFVVAVIGIGFGLIPLVYYYGENNGLYYLLVINAIVGSTFTLLYHIIVNESLPVFMHKLKQLNPVVHIAAPTVASAIIGIAMYYSLTGLSFPLSVVYIIIPLLVILALGITYVMRNNNIKMDTLSNEAENRERMKDLQ